MTENNQNSNEISAVGVLKKTVDGNYRLRKVTSMLIGHFIMCILIVPPAIIMTLTSEKLERRMNDGMGFFVLFLLGFVYLNKDFCKGKSPAKRILGFQVINGKTEKPATELQCFVRNLTICIA